MGYEISVVMPALNEEHNIALAVENTVAAFQRLNTKGEIIVINDGSTDRTAEIVEGLSRKYPFLKLIRHASPKGIGRSFWDGVEASSGENVTMLPGDAENDAHEILRYLPLMAQVDIVIPFVFNQGQRPFLRRLISKIYRGVINLTFGTSLNYMNGTVLYRRCVLESVELQSDGFFYQTELLVKCLRAGFLYAEVPYGLKRRAKGKSKALSLKSFRRLSADYLRTYAVTRTQRAKLPAFPLRSITLQRHQMFQS
jgi:glycosyltransferase involved in cell wall biosynthesis